MPVTITRVETAKILDDGRWVAQTKFTYGDRVGISVHWSASSDLGTPSVLFKWSIIWEIVGSYFDTYYEDWGSFGYPFNWKGGNFSGRLPHDGTDWVTHIDYGHYFHRRPGYNKLKFYVTLDADGIDGMPVTSQEYMIGLDRN